jgi:hypothetical protein
MNNNDVKLNRMELNRLLNQCMVLDSLLSNFKFNDYKLEATNETSKNHYDKLHDEVCKTIRMASKKLERIHKQEIKNKK